MIKPSSKAIKAKLFFIDRVETHCVRNGPSKPPQSTPSIVKTAISQGTPPNYAPCIVARNKEFIDNNTTPSPIALFGFSP